METSDAPRLDWQILNDQAHLGIMSGRVVAIAYAVEAASSDGGRWLEFCWVPVDAPDQIAVHFGVGPGTGSAWETRWDRAHKATEWDYAERVSV